MKLERVASARDPRIADYLDVRDPRWLREQRIFLAEGRKVVTEVLRAERFRLRSLLVTPPALDALGDALQTLPAETPVYLVERAQLDGVSGVRFHQGCVGAVDVPPPLRPAEVLRGAQRVVVLEAVTDPDNVGSTFRNAAAFGFDAVLVGPRCASPLYRKAIRTSLGATLRVPFAPIDLPEGIARLRGRSIRTLGLTPDPGAPDLASDGLAPRVALLLGSEAEGLTAETLAACDARLRIPMGPAADSINVAAAGAVAMHHIYARRTASR
ncbi:MAG: RNA methyltransferase [Deltaproteobacteria bacterium]|nr:RNA methyltransferase [Deltaproteobacteria bacterium]MBW2414114.1 RNA methyltransferase [Deltaproteobacteria bacterium]